MRVLDACGLYATLLGAACGGMLRSDPLPSRRPATPYLCAVANGGAGEVIIYATGHSVRLMRVGSQTQCRTLPRLQEVHIGFEPTSGLWDLRVYWTPIPLHPFSENVECYFVDAGNPRLAVGMIRPCIER